MNTPASGLRPPSTRLRNVSKQPVKLEVVVPPGDELTVSEDVAGQAVEKSRGSLRVADSKVDATADAAAAAVAPVADEPEEKPAPKKRAAKKAAAKPAED